MQTLPKEDLTSFIQNLPKAELHLHIEGTLEPELAFALAARNQVTLPYSTVEAARDAYSFHDLQSFLDIYYAMSSSLRVQQDFYDLTSAYMTKAHEQNVQHTEIFFDPQAHTARGVAFPEVILGISKALEDAKQRYNMTSAIILCFLRDLSPESGPQSAMATLEAALPFKHLICGVGLDSAERPYPPRLFQSVFDKARAHGFKITAHAGEEGPVEYIWEALNLLKATRIDHGVQSIYDAALIAHLRETQIALTMCPLSNLKLGVCAPLLHHPLKKLLHEGVCVTINSDDPAYFGGHLNENYLAITEALGLTQKELQQLAENSFKAAFVETSYNFNKGPLS